MTDLRTEQTTPRGPAFGGSVWNAFTTETRMTAKEYVDSITILLQGVLDANGRQDPHILIDQLRATLELGGTHSSMPIPTAQTRPVRELLDQAERISEQLIIWADDALSRSIGDPQPLSEPLLVRSHCDGHTLIPGAIHSLLGPQGGPVPMMLYNEWIHQMVLLRDSLLPFSNWADVPLAPDGKGLRRVEAARERFLAELLIRQIRHTSIVDYARDVLVPDNDSHTDGYGFAYAEGTVLPHVTASPSVLTSTDLLVWSRSGAIDTDDHGGSVETYTPRQSDYFESPRTAPAVIAPSTDGPGLATADARVVESSAADGTRHATIEVTTADADGVHTVGAVDLGQALRGHRYAYSTAAATGNPPRDVAEWTANATSLNAADVVAADGLVWDDDGDFVVDLGQDGLVALALLGTIYPENVVLRRRSDDVRPSAVGKTGPARFVLTLPE